MMAMRHVERPPLFSIVAVLHLRLCVFVCVCVIHKAEIADYTMDTGTQWRHTQRALANMAALPLPPREVVSNHKGDGFIVCFTMRLLHTQCAVHPGLRECKTREPASIDALFI